MNPAHISIMIIGDNATHNLLTAFVLKHFFKGPEISLVSDPAIALRSIVGIAPELHTYVFLDTVTRGMTWHLFIECFAELDISVRKNYSIYMPLPSAYSFLYNVSAQYPEVTVLPKPLNLGILRDYAITHRCFSKAFPRHTGKNIVAACSANYTAAHHERNS